MSDLTIRPAYSKWPDYQRAFRDVVAGLTVFIWLESAGSWQAWQ